MIFMKISYFFLIFFCFSCFTGYSQQRVKDFYLSNIKEDGTKDWEVEGREAQIDGEYVNIDEMKASYYGQKDKIVITSDKARLDKSNMDVELRENVNIVNGDGSTLLTESLDWQQSKNHIKTEDWVTTTTKDNMQIKAKGLSADTAFKTADFEKNVLVTLPNKETDDNTTVTCSGPLEIEYASGTAIFNDEVVVTHPQGKLFSDKTTLYFDNKEQQIEKIVCEGNVKIVREDNITFSKKATYYGSQQKLILEGRPRLIYFTENKGE
jgi:LPS export ABC transporter protein LptC